MALVDSLLTAMVRANGDALVMHVGEKPIVVAGSKTIDLSSHGLNLSAMVGMLGQLLPADAQSSLREFGAVEHRLPARGTDRFTVVAARGGEDIWIEIRRRREKAAAAPAGVVAPPAPIASAESPIAPVEEARTDAPASVERAHTPDRRSAQGSVLEEAPDTEPERAASSETGARPEAVAALEATATPEVAAGEPAVPTPHSDRQAELAAESGATTAPDALAASDAAAALEVAAPVEAAAEPGSVAEPQPAAEAEPAAELQADAERAPGDEPDAFAEQAPAVAEASDSSHEEPAHVMAESAGLAPTPELAGGQGPEEEPEAVVEAESTHAEPVADMPAADDVRPDAPEPERVEAAEGVSTPASEAEPPPATEIAVREAVQVAPAAAASAETADVQPTPAEVEHATVPAMASAGFARYPASERTKPMSPMETSPHSGSPGGPPVPPASSLPAAAGAPASDGVSALPSLMRTVRIEVPSRAASPRSAGAYRLIRAADGHSATELFLMSQARPCMRVEGELRVLDGESSLAAADIEALIADLTPEPWRDAVHRGDPAEWLIEVAEVGRVRCASFRDQRGPGAIFHFTSTHASSAEQLGLGAEAQSLATEPDGLVVIAGPAGSDKAAVVAAFVDTINRHRSDYVITLEPQVRVQHENQQALVSQREVGTDTARAVLAARAALRENPDVLVMEDVASGEMVGVALDAANQGRLVLLSIEVGSTAEAVERLIELVPADRQQAARVALSRSFRGAIAQLLLRKASGGRVAARELLMGTQAVAKLIKEGARADLVAAIESGRDAGMAPLVDALVGYVQSGVVDVREAFRKAPDRERLMAGFRAAGVDTTVIDRLS